MMACRSRAAQGDPRGAAEIDQHRAVAKRTQTAFNRALAAHHRLPARLGGVGDAARERAIALGALHQAGAAPKGIKAKTTGSPRSSCTPTSSAPERSRPGRHSTDRSKDSLAALADPDPSFAQHAAAYETVATATDQG
jgi:hypothetical protein